MIETKLSRLSCFELSSSNLWSLFRDSIFGFRISGPDGGAGLVYIIDFNQPDSGAAVVAGQDGGEGAWWQRNEDA